MMSGTYHDKVLKALKDAVSLFEEDGMVIIEGHAFDAILDQTGSSDWPYRGETISQLERRYQIGCEVVDCMEDPLLVPGLKAGDAIIQFNNKQTRIKFKLTYGV